uniref:Uncharacterized protein n=1 Tax=Anguilla anguilla TaxID=7936 RepID=A0A0E9RLD2_ANGAN
MLLMFTEPIMEAKVLTIKLQE